MSRRKAEFLATNLLLDPKSRSSSLSHKKKKKNGSRSSLLSHEKEKKEGSRSYLLKPISIIGVLFLLFKLIECTLQFCYIRENRRNQFKENTKKMLIFLKNNDIKRMSF